MLERGEVAERIAFQEQIDAYARIGLRTLVCGKKELDREGLRVIDKGVELAEGDAEALQQLLDAEECGLDVLGATAIEDKLQEGVPEAIAMLLSAE